MNGTRRNARNLCTDLLSIRWRDASGATRREFAALEDISPSGVCLYVEQPIPEDTVLTILYPRGRYEGRVKYCKNHPAGHLIGIEFEAGYRWSRRQYDPPHLLRFGFGGDSDD